MPYVEMIKQIESVNPLIPEASKPSADDKLFCVFIYDLASLPITFRLSPSVFIQDEC